MPALQATPTTHKKNVCHNETESSQLLTVSHSPPDICKSRTKTVNPAQGVHRPEPKPVRRMASTS